MSIHVHVILTNKLKNTHRYRTHIHTQYKLAYKRKFTQIAIRGMQERLLQVQRDADKRIKAEVEEAVNRVRRVELSKMRLEEHAKYQVRCKLPHIAHAYHGTASRCILERGSGSTQVKGASQFKVVSMLCMHVLIRSHFITRT
jgi:hypothetical protein